jgi:hypothetical protein
MYKLEQFPCTLKQRIEEPTSSLNRTLNTARTHISSAIDSAAKHRFLEPTSDGNKLVYTLQLTYTCAFLSIEDVN